MPCIGNHDECRPSLHCTRVRASTTTYKVAATAGAFGFLWSSPLGWACRPLTNILNRGCTHLMVIGACQVRYKVLPPPPPPPPAYHGSPPGHPARRHAQPTAQQCWGVGCMYLWRRPAAVGGSRRGPHKGLQVLAASYDAGDEACLLILPQPRPVGHERRRRAQHRIVGALRLWSSIIGCLQLTRLMLGIGLRSCSVGVVAWEAESKRRHAERGDARVSATADCGLHRCCMAPHSPLTCSALAQLRWPPTRPSQSVAHQSVRLSHYGDSLSEASTQPTHRSATGQHECLPYGRRTPTWEDKVIAGSSSTLHARHVDYEHGDCMCSRSWGGSGSSL